MNGVKECVALLQAVRKMLCGAGGFTSQSAVWPDTVVVVSPPVSQDLRFIQIAKQLPVEELVPHPAVETLTTSAFIAVLLYVPDTPAVSLPNPPRPGQ